MKDFETGVGYLRKVATAAGLVIDSDNNDVLVDRVATLITNATEAGIEGVFVEADESGGDAATESED